MTTPTARKGSKRGVQHPDLHNIPATISAHFAASPASMQQMASGAMPRYLSEKEVSSRLGISYQKLRKDRLHGTGIPYCKFGRAVRYSLEAVLQYEADAKRHSTAEDRS